MGVLAGTSGLTLAACDEAGPYTTTVYTVTASDAAHVSVSVAVFNAGNAAGDPSCVLTASSPAGTGRTTFRPAGDIGVAKSVVLHELVHVPGNAAGAVGYDGVRAVCT